MSVTDIVIMYLVKSQEATQMLYNAEFYQYRQIDKFTTHSTRGYNGNL